MSKNQVYQQNFEAEIRSLNPEQSVAVSTIEGPVLVIAGPGTGKTQILAARIGMILLKTDTRAQNILCLTFTDNGRVEMRNRLFKLIGPDAYRVHIHTFHSFCNMVIQENLSYFGKLGLEPLSELEEMELLHRLIDGIEAGNKLKRYKGEIYYDWSRLKELFTFMKKEAWPPDYLLGKITDYLAEIPERPEFRYKRGVGKFKAGDLNQRLVDIELDRMETLAAGVSLFPKYDRLMQEASRYTFEDMILWVLKAFRENANLLADYQERYLYFLVDEFQDTSGSQNQLLDQLIQYWEKPNVFVVGDDDQSIFSFQDANVANIREFAHKFGNDLCKVVLKENYRSTQAILDAAKILITHNQDRIIKDDPNLTKDLIAANPLLQHIRTKPDLTEYQTPLAETMGVAEHIENLIHDGVSPADIAIIYRNHRQGDELANFLGKKKIALNIRRKLNILELPFVRKVIRIMEYISLESTIPYSGEELLFEILHYDFFRIRPVEIARISSRVNLRHTEDNREKQTLRKAISEPFRTLTPSLFDPADGNKINHTGLVLDSLVGRVKDITLQQFFEDLIRECGILGYIMQSPEKIWLMQVLQSLFDFIKEENGKDPEMGLTRLVNIFRLMDKNNISVNLEKVISSEEGVNMVTAHGSKGSQFGHVFIIGCNKSIWDDENLRGKTGFRFPDNLYASHSLADSLEESRRLFYVAMTRAKTHLHLSWPTHNNNGKELERSAFVSEVMENIPEVSKAIVDETRMTENIARQFREDEPPQIELLESRFIDQLLKNYSLSVTHLNNFLDCPIKFYYQSLIKVPSAKNESMTFGSAVHHALQRLFEKMKERQHVFPAKDELIGFFAWYMQINRECFTNEQFARRMEYGKKILPEFYDFYLKGWNKTVIVEKSINNIEVNGVPLNGKLDKLEFDGQQVNVVDYKTGKYEEALKRLHPPDDKNPLGGHYWRQAVFYKILLDNDHTNNWEAISSEFCFVEPVKNEYKTEKVLITRVDLDIVTRQITETWDKIRRHEFHTGCGKKDCHWCNFVRDNQMELSLSEMAAGEEE